MTGNRWTRFAQTAPISHRHDFESNHEPKQTGKHLRRQKDVGGAQTFQ
jgi:hypothetical protein